MTYDASPQLQEVLTMMADPNVKKSLQINNFWGANQIPPQFRNWFYKSVQDWLVKGDFSADYLKKADAEWDTEVKAMKNNKQRLQTENLCVTCGGFPATAFIIQ